jgi:hypothetical protein
MYLHHTRDMMSTLGALATAMGAIEGTKAIVLVSEGLITESTTIDSLKKFAQACERARVSFYAMHLEAPLSDAEMLGGNAAPSRALDERAGLAGMSEMSSWARGTTIRVPGPATNALEQIDTELSGYYLLSFERDPTDREGEPAGIQVSVNRPNVNVRARREFTPGLPATPVSARPAAADLKTEMTSLLNWPTAATDLAIDVDAFVTPVAGSARDARLLVVGEIARDPASVKAIGYALVNDAGKIIADQFDSLPNLQALADGRSFYAFALAANPGRYRLKLGVIDANGARGSIEHRVEVMAWPAGRLRVSDLMLSDETSGVFRPVARVRSESASLSARVELHADTADAFGSAKVRLQILRASDGGVLGSLPLALGETNQNTRRVAGATLDISKLVPGQYIITVTVDGAGPDSVIRSRLFTK